MPPDGSPDPALTLPERLLRRERAVLALLMGLLFGTSALYTVLGIGMNMSALDMTAMAGMRDMPGARAAGVWSASQLVLMFLMWWIMMIAMMLPSVAPTLLLYARLIRFGRGASRVVRLTSSFAGGYLSAWAVFSMMATGTHWAGEALGIVSATMMTLIQTTPGAILLILAGLFQFTSLKHRCLTQCQSPVYVLTRHYRPGLAGAFQLGLRHGVFCLGCCWALMALLFVGGVMNLYWICALAAYVALEKLTPWGALLGKICGGALVLWGLTILARTL